MNDDRIIGAGRGLAGKAEWAVGDAIGSDRLQADGIVDRVAGVFQNGYGKAKDAASDALVDAPEALNGIANRGRDLTRQLDATMRRELGEHGPLYVLAGAVGLLGLGLFALASSRATPKAAARPTTAPSAAQRKPRAGAPRTRRTKSVAS